VAPGWVVCRPDERWVFTPVSRDLRTWREEVTPDLRMAVNPSARQLSQDSALTKGIAERQVELVGACDIEDVSVITGILAIKVDLALMELYHCQYFRII